MRDLGAFTYEYCASCDFVLNYFKSSAWTLATFVSFFFLFTFIMITISSSICLEVKSGCSPCFSLGSHYLPGELLPIVTMIMRAQLIKDCIILIDTSVTPSNPSATPLNPYEKLLEPTERSKQIVTKFFTQIIDLTGDKILRTE